MSRESAGKKAYKTRQYNKLREQVRLDAAKVEAKRQVLAERAKARKKRAPVVKRQREISPVEEEMTQEQRIQRELARRALCRRSLLAFVMRFEPNYKPGWVHRQICEALEKFSDDVLAGLSPRLMIQMPPRHGKSLLASVYFPAWHLGRAADNEIIACSYASALALTFSRKVRQVVRDPRYKSIFPDLQLDKDSQAAEAWSTLNGGMYSAVGVGGPITGKGANALLVDDPIKNAEDAESQVTRTSQKNWYQSTAYTRLMPGGGVLVIQTRWHDDDLSGWLEELMRKGEGDHFVILRFSATATEDEEHRAAGEALHPERYSLEALAQIRRSVGPRVWAALYQQTPVEEEGAYFKRDWVKYYNQLPDGNYRYYAAWDLAISKKERADYTVGVVVAVDEPGDVWVVDLVRGRMDALEITEAMIDTHVLWKTQINGIEKSHILQSIQPFVDKRRHERPDAVGFYYEPLPPGRQDKEMRARPIQAMSQQGRVHVPRDAAWTSTLVHEMLRFPHGVNDDCVDALAWVGQMLVNLVGGEKTKTPAKKSWKDKLTKFVRGSGRTASAMAA